LNKATISESKADNEVGCSDTTDLNVDEGQHEGGQCESRETERGGVGEFAVGDWLVETWLEFTTEGRETRRVAGVDVGKWVSAIVVGLDLIAGRGGGAVVDSSNVVLDNGLFLFGRHFVALSVVRSTKKKKSKSEN
jgi:hypothetical protein